MKKWVAFGVLILIYGSGFMFVDVAIRQVTPLELTLVRFIMATIGLSLMVTVRKQNIPRDWRTWRAFTIIGIFNFSVPFILISWAQQTVESGLAGVLISTNPLFSMIVAHFAFSDERMTPASISGVVAGFIGAGILATRNWQGGTLVAEGLLAQLLIIFSAFLFAAMSTYSRKVMQRQIDPIVVALGTSATAMLFTLLLWLIAVISGQPLPNPAELSSDTIFALGILGFFNAFIAFSLLYYVIRELGVTRTSTMTYIIPLIALALGHIFLGETFDERVILGTIIILSGIALVNMKRRPQPAQPEAVPIEATE